MKGLRSIGAATVKKRGFVFVRKGPPRSLTVAALLHTSILQRAAK